MARILLTGAALALCAAAARADLTEADVVGLALSRAEVTALLDARRDAAAGQARAAGRWSNPEIDYTEETLDLAAGDSDETFLWIRQRLNVAGVKGLERNAAARLQAAEEARIDYARREIAAEVRRLFYRAVAAARTHAAVADWRSRLEELSQAVRQRVEAGDASRYDALRLERELAIVDARVADLQADAASARDRLFARVGAPDDRLDGVLLPPAVETLDVRGIIDGHPLLQALAAEADGAATTAEAARRSAWPEVTIGVGRREYTDPTIDTDGNLLMVGVEVPLFDRGDGPAQAADGRARRLAAERALAADRLAADVRTALRELAARRAAAERLATAAGDETLAAIAESAYAAGEIGVLELIDAHRADLAALTASVERAGAARESYIDLQTLKDQP